MSGKRAKAERRMKAGAQADWSSLDRRMFADDVNWIYSTIESANSAGDVTGSALSLACMPYMARVTYEGSDLLRRQRPEAARSLGKKYAEQVASLRHSMKLLDDTHKSFESIVAELDSIRADHQHYFSNSLLSEITVNGLLVTSSRTVSYQTSWSMAEATSVTSDEPPSYRLALEMGQTAAAIANQFGYVPRATHLDGLADLVARFDNAETDEFHRRHYGELSTSEGEVLLLAESAINSAWLILEPAKADHRNAVFRARMIALCHAVNAIQQVLAISRSRARRAEALATVLASGAVNRVTGYRTLRNRSMHYGIPASLAGLSAHSLGYGLVEATTGRGFEEVERDLETALSDLSEAFGPAH
ncbi:hypothetical protein Q9S78_11975 [Microbacterium sp. KSW-18]|uniref:Uncharacterized protein n=1 Tax=Microbacterium aquilitoris TaxID=3067307 RepID=A0ABU3GL61_9MICO|nr:hypothetical protein [Microbacterium sp. KSW-18]MDT3331386.1 hypothetical protein [Microbacterium sp. KSW-18]